MFYAPKRTFDTVASGLAFFLVLCTWIAVYGIVCPADPAPHQVHLAQARP